MANVIPEDMRTDMSAHRRARFILTGSMVAIIAALLALLSLVPSYLVLAAGVSSSNLPAVLSPAQVASDTAAISSTDRLLSELAPLIQASSTPTSAIDAALSRMPAGMTVDQISYTAGSPSTIVLSGVAAATGQVASYRTALAADPLFSSVSVPVGALVGTDGGRFSITLSGAF